MNNINNFKRTCFFCSEPITERKTLEHIIPNSLLGKLGIKKEKMNVVETTECYEYSRIKVPAHNQCNSGFGSQYESKVIDLFANYDKLYRLLIEEENEDFHRFFFPGDDSITSTISIWLMKIYYGLFYHDYLKTKNKSRKEVSKKIIESTNFNMIRKSYKDGYNFHIPSSLFVLNNNNYNSNFYLRTRIEPQCILMRIKSLSFILCIGDGGIAKQYLNIQYLREYLETLQSENSDFPTHLYAFAEILALMSSLPEKPIHFISDREIVNMSYAFKDLYPINNDEIKKMRKLFLADFNIF